MGYDDELQIIPN